MTNKEIEDFCPGWNNLYPPNLEFNGLKLRSPLNEVVKRMLKFCKDHPTYTKELIFAATQTYISEKAKQNYEYMKRSMYFISKLGEQSLLEAYCEKLNERYTASKLPENVAKYPITIEQAYNEMDDFI